jgi:hypothetical protein
MAFDYRQWLRARERDADRRVYVIWLVIGWMLWIAIGVWLLF